MTAVLGLDLSCSRSGVAAPTGRTLSIAPRTTDIGPRLHLVAGAVAKVVRAYRPQLAVIEDYAPNSRGRLSTIRLAELGGAVRMMLHELDVPFVTVGPGQLKRWATGNGNATDDRMIAAARAAGADPANDDEADAYLLRAVALHALDQVDLLDGHDHHAARLDVIAAIQWPALR